MKGFSIVLTGNAKKLSVLCKNGLIPKDDIEIDTGIKLRKKDLFFKNILGVRFYYTKNFQNPINGWKWIPLISLERLEDNFGAFLCEALGKFWKVMPGFNKKLGKIRLPLLFKKGNFSEEVIFFPGSFNPWHVGHNSCIKLCPNKSKIIVVPDNNPWKINRKVIEGCKWQRYRTLCLELEGSTCSIYSGFLGQGKENPTVNWLPKTKAKKRILLVGDDSFLSLKRWKDSKKLISSIQKIYVVPRIGIEQDLKLMKKELMQINSKLKIKILPPHEFQNVSSSKIRGD